MKPFCHFGYRLCYSSTLMSGAVSHWRQDGGAPSLTRGLPNPSFHSLKYLLRTCAKIFKNQIWPLSFLKLCPCSNNLNMTLLRLAAYYPKSSNLSKFIFFHSSKMELVTKCLQDWCLSAIHNSYFMINISLARSAQMASHIGCGFHQWTYVH